MSAPSPIVDLLSRVPIFEKLSLEDLARLASVTVPRVYRSGESIFREGDQGDVCYLVKSGRVRAVREHPSGRSLALAQFGPGDMFGELSMFDEETRSASVEAMEDTEAIAILGSDMRRVVRENPEMSLKLLSGLAQRLRAANERLAGQSFQSVQGRVATALQNMVDDAIAQGASADRVLLKVTQSDIAQLAGSSRESASRFLATLERAGVIKQGRGRLIVHDRGALDRYVY